jgi:hypothetical protein
MATSAQSSCFLFGAGHALYKPPLSSVITILSQDKWLHKTRSLDPILTPELVRTHWARTTSCWPASGTNKVCLPVFDLRRARMTDKTHRVQTQLHAAGSLWYWIHHRWHSAVHNVCFALHQFHNKVDEIQCTKLHPHIFDTIWGSIGNGLGSK